MRSILLLSMLVSSAAFAFKPSKAPRAHAPPKVAADAPQATDAPREVQRGRLEFEKPMNVTGQRAGANAVELYDRKLLSTTSMVKTRDSFRDVFFEER